MSVSILFVSTVLALCQGELLAPPVTVECVDESALHQFTYHAPARVVPKSEDRKEISAATKRGFLELFRREYSPHHEHGSPQDALTFESQCGTPNSIPMERIEGINNLLALNDTHSSFSDRNQEAIIKLMQEFMDAATPEDLLTLARDQLHRHTFNQKTWYYALVSVLLIRPDLHGISLPWPIDATPDNYIPNTIIRLARERSSRPARASRNGSCTTSAGLFYKYTTYSVSGGAAAVAAGGLARRKRGFHYEPYGPAGYIPYEPQPDKKGKKEEEDDDEEKDICDRTRYSNPVFIPYPTKETKGWGWGRGWHPEPHYHHDLHHHHHHPDDYHHHHHHHPHDDHDHDPHVVNHKPIFETYPILEVHEKKKKGGGYQKQSQISYLHDPYHDHFHVVPAWGIPGWRKKRSPPQASSSQAVKTTENSQTNGEGQGYSSGPTGSRDRDECILYNGTQGATGEENRLWYFREDMLLNQHHWYWHQFNPKVFPEFSGAGSRKPDRRGEIFLFSHHTMVARYNAERLSNGLPLVSPLEFHKNSDIGPGYNPDLIDEFTGRFWTPRLANTPLSDIIQKTDRNFGFNMKINDVANSLSTLLQHVKQGYLLNKQLKEEPYPVDIKNLDGLSHLGNTIEESPRQSANRDLYQSVHSLGHLAISVATDPNNKCGLLKGVMSDVAVAMRDPAFYRIHALVDTLFTQHKNTLPPYQLHGGDWPLQWDGVRLQSVEVLAGNGQKSNYVKTFWSHRRFRLEEGIDGSIHDGDVNADICHQHLNHEQFKFKLVVDMDSCAKTVSNKGTVRIFMAPRFDLDGRRFSMEETRHLVFQLDAFPVDLRRGRNTITRYSQDSSATKPWSRTLQQMLDDPNNGNQTEYCGCGWPRHLYIPRGRGDQGGMAFDLFAMVTNYEQDQVVDPVEDLIIPEPCNSPYIYCGKPFRKYPDARPMGYPFDRLPYSVVEAKHIPKYGGFLEEVKVLRPVHNLEEYVAHVSNMQSAIMLIQHVDTVINA